MKRFLIILLTISTLAIAAVGVFLALQIAQTAAPGGSDSSSTTSGTSSISDIPVANNCCGTGGQGGGPCNSEEEWQQGWYNCNNGGCDACRSSERQCGNGKCDAGESENGPCAQDCKKGGGDNPSQSSGGSSSGGGGGGKKCSNTSGSCQNKNIGDVIGIEGGSCTCQINGGGNICGCIVDGGTSCGTGSDQYCGGKSFGEACRNLSGEDFAYNYTCQYTSTSGGKAVCGCRPSGTSGGQCEGNTDCAGNEYCDSGLCRRKRGLGETCNESGQCASGRCNLDDGTCRTQNNSGCTGSSGCSPGQYCARGYGICYPKLPNESWCSFNSQCISGICRPSTECYNGVCRPKCAAPGGVECRGDSECTGDKICSAGYCVNKKSQGSTCYDNTECQAGFSCISNICQTTPSGAPPERLEQGASCEPGSYCESNGSGFGHICSNGKLGARTKLDACAPAVQEGQSCEGVPRFSNGEPSRGKFVGCNGTLNCFCGSPESQDTITCYPDIGNDSCGANAGKISGGSTTPPPNNPPGTNPPPGTTNPPPAVQTQCLELIIKSPPNSTSTPTPPGTTYAVNATWTCTGLDNNLNIGIFDSNNNLITTGSQVGSGNYNSSTNRCRYTFQVTSPLDAANQDYTVKQMGNGTPATRIDSPTSCTKPLTISDTASPPPGIIVTKEGGTNCAETVGDNTIITWTITVTNIGTTPTLVSDLIDNLPLLIDGATDLANITPAPTSITSSTITWEINENFAAGESRQYTYQMVLSPAQVQTLNGQALENTAVAVYGPDGETYEFIYVVDIEACLPDTAIFDNINVSLPLAVGLLLILAGLAYNRSQVMITHRIAAQQARRKEEKELTYMQNVINYQAQTRDRRQG